MSVKTWADCTLREQAASLSVPPFLEVREDLDVIALMDHGPWLAVVQAETVDRAIVRASYLLAWNDDADEATGWDPCSIVVGLLQEWLDRQQEMDPWHQMTWTVSEQREAWTRQALVKAQTAFWRTNVAREASWQRLRPVHDVVQSL